ncbi:sulfite exporter TauE/SafE family protein [Aliagarivorans marinus]|uniref:sulfite exporter TauE/SafE family protein n=1 Tax=Aliagarivorans marinus TaxID=561965 RepID=UPI00041AD0A4|nr:TSUP family transporter [Aliagarivorans marinus]
MLELGFDLSVLLLVVGVGLSAGFIDAIAGGGGLLTVPALLSIGLPPHLALGTNKLAASFGSSTAAWTYYRKQLFNPVFWRWSFVATALGATVGTFVVDFISTAWLDKLLPLVIIATAIYTIINRKQAEGKDALPEVSPQHHRRTVTQGFSLGFYDGVAGPGTGAFWTVSSMALYKMNILLSSGLAKAMNFTSNFVSFLTFVYLGHVSWALGLSMGVSIMVGAYIGAHSAIKFGAKFIRPVFITVVLIIAGKLALQAWFS